MTIKNYLPEKLLENTNTDKFLDVVQALMDSEIAEIEKYERSFNPQLTDTVEGVRKYVKEFNGEYLLETTRKVLECLYNNKNNFYSHKGTEANLTAILNCYLQQYSITVTRIDYFRGYPFLNFWNLDAGVLPNGQDLADELDGLYSPDKYVVTLLGNDWIIHYKSIIVQLSLSLPNELVTTFIKNIIFLFSPMLESINSICINPTDNVLENGGESTALQGYPTIRNGGLDNPLQTFNIIQT